MARETITITEEEFYQVEHEVRMEQTDGSGGWYDVDYLIDGIGKLLRKKKEALDRRRAKKQKGVT